MFKLLKNLSLSKKVSFMFLAMIILSTSIIAVIGYYLYRTDAINANAARARDIAETIASAIDPEQFVEILDSNEINQYWHDTKNYIDEVIDRTGVMYLYILDKNYDENVYYFMEASPGDDSETIELGGEESIEYHAEEMFDTIRTGVSSTTDIYDADEYGKMVSGFAPILNGNTVIGVVGVDISISHVMDSTNFFMFVIIICVIIFGALFWFISGVYVKKSVGNPIRTLLKASAMIAEGNMDISLNKNSNDEIGKLTESFLEMINSTRKQIKVLEKIANNDLTADLNPRGSNDSMNTAIKKTINNLHKMLGEIKNASLQVSRGSEQIADDSRSLAEGATEQTSIIEQLSVSLDGITHEAEKSADLANNSANLAKSIMHNIKKGNSQMNEMISAVSEIDHAGAEILKVTKVIDDIAFQTNILALNASIEAARAGQHGKGFAVVAEEVRNLAAKSKEAAKDTEKLIANSVEKADLGSRIARETADTLDGMVSDIDKSNRLALDIAEISKKQAESIVQMGLGLNQVSEVVSSNSASAQESASASEEMSGQANLLKALVDEFVL